MVPEFECTRVAFLQKLHYDEMCLFQTHVGFRRDGLATTELPSSLQVNECTAELKGNLQEEHLAGMEFIGTVFKTIFNPLQKARAIVQSYPFYPDVYQVLS